MAERYLNKILTVPNFLSLVRLLLIPVMVWLYLVREAPERKGRGR